MFFYEAKSAILTLRSMDTHVKIRSFSVTWTLALQSVVPSEHRFQIKRKHEHVT